MPFPLARIMVLSKNACSSHTQPIDIFSHELNASQAVMNEEGRALFKTSIETREV